jgi:hypothetical protein
LGFNAFGGYSDTEIVGEVSDRGDDQSRADMLIQCGDERLVDLDDVDRS